MLTIYKKNNKPNEFIFSDDTINKLRESIKDLLKSINWFPLYKFIKNDLIPPHRIVIISKDKINEFKRLKKEDYIYYCFSSPWFSMINFDECLENMRHPPTLFRLCLKKLFKNACHQEIHDTLNKCFSELPYKITRIINYQFIRSNDNHICKFIDEYIKFHYDSLRPKWTY